MAWGTGPNLRQLAPSNANVGITAIVMAVIVGFAGFVVVHMVWESVWVLVILVCGLFVAFSQHSSPLGIVGWGLYALASLIALVPAIYLLDLLIGAPDPDGGALWIAEIIYRSLSDGRWRS